MIANIASAKLPTIATRSASCGVIGGRPILGRLGHRRALAAIWPSRSDGLLQRAEPAGRVGAPAPAARVVGQRRVDDPAHDRVDRQRDQRVDEHGHEDLLEQQQADRRVDAEQELDQRHPDPGDGGRGGAGRQRDEAVGGVAQLAQAPGPVADRDVQQRGDAERLDEHRVDEQPGGEAR